MGKLDKQLKGIVNVVEANLKWAFCEKAAHVLTVLQGQVADILHSVPAGAMDKDIIGDLKRPAAHWAQVKVRTQLSSKSLQEIAAAIKHWCTWPLLDYLWSSLRRTPLMHLSVE